MQLRAELKTARLTLRPLASEDEGVVVAVLNDLAVTGWLSLVPYTYRPADFHHFHTEIARPGETYVVQDDHGLAGVIGAGQEFGYWFAPRCHGQGYATEASRAVLAEQLACDPAEVASGYFESNHRSANVLRKLGFVEAWRGTKHCRALGHERPYVAMSLTPAGFVASLPIEVRSARMSYRALQATDREALHDIVSHWEVVRQLASWPWPADRAFTRDRAWPYAGAGFVWGAFLAGRLIGTVAVTGGELGYGFAPDFWRKGLGEEACRTALTHAFGRLDLPQVTAGVWSDNAASRGLLTKLGFAVTGESNGISLARGGPTAGLALTLTRERYVAGAPGALKA